MRSSIPAWLLLLSSCASPALTWHMVAAFALWTSVGCVIWSIEPETWKELVEIWQHERQHCLEGAFH